MKQLKEISFKDWHEFSNSITGENSEKLREEVLATYLEAKRTDRVKKYQYSYYTLEVFNNIWVLAREYNGLVRKVVLNKEELEMLDINDIEGTLKDLAYYVDMVEQKFGM